MAPGSSNRSNEQFRGRGRDESRGRRSRGKVAEEETEEILGEEDKGYVNRRVDPLFSAGPPEGVGGSDIRGSKMDSHPAICCRRSEGSLTPLSTG